MKGSVSETIRSMVNRNPIIKQMLKDDLLNCSSYSLSVKNQVEQIVGKQVGQNSIIMALRRYCVELKNQEEEAVQTTKVKYQIVMHTNIFDYNLQKTESVLSRMSEIYQTLPNTHREFINFVVGTNEVGVVASQEYLPQIKKLIKGQKILFEADDLVAFTMVFSGPFLSTPGIIHEAVQQLAWRSINLIELVSTMNELTFIVKSRDSLATYEILQSFQE